MSSAGRCVPVARLTLHCLVWSLGALLCVPGAVLQAQVERPAAGASQPTQGMGQGQGQGQGPGGGAGGGQGGAGGGMGTGRAQTPPDPAGAADPRNFNGMWQQADSGMGAGGGAPGGAPGAGPQGAGPQGAGPAGAGGAAGMAGGPAPTAGGVAGMAAGGTQGEVVMGKSKLLCIPPAGSIYAGGVGGVQFVQTATQLNIVAEENHRVRRIYINGQHPKNLQPSYMGHSIGKWEGNTLVVDTTGVKGSPQVHSIERITKNASGTSLEILSSTVDAQGKTTQGRAMTLNWLSGRDIAEWICEDYSDEFYSDDYK